MGADGALAHMRRHRILVLHSTVSAAFMLRLQKACNERDIGFVCAPVSDSLPEAEAGRLTAIAGSPGGRLFQERFVETFLNLSLVLRSHGAVRLQ